MRRATPLLLAAALAAQDPALLDRLADPDPRVRDTAVAGVRPEAGTLAALAGALGSDDPYLRGAAALALGRLGAPAVPVLAEVLAGGTVPARTSAAIALGRCGPAALAALPELTATLEHPDATLRHMAAAALGGLGPAAVAAGPALTARLPDPDESVRAAVALALRQVDPAGRAAHLRPAALEATVARLVSALMADLKVPGVAVALIRDRNVAWSRGFGVTEASGTAAVTPETVFEVASMSKPVAALLALQLAGAGRLDLDRPLADYGVDLPRPDLPARARITARMALAHTTGLPNWRPGGEELEGPVPQLAEPGGRFGYSGEGYFLLQRALERITGEPLAPLAEARLFRPMGLGATGFAWTPALDPRLATGHDSAGRPLPRARHRHANAAYTLYSSAEDYARILVAVLRAERGDGALLPLAGLRAALTPQVRLDARAPIERPGAARGTAAAWGLGWSLNETGQGPIAHQGGSNSTGFRCFSQFSPERGSGLVVLTNGTGGGDLCTRLVAAIGDL